MASIYDKIGGLPSLVAVIDRLYSKVLADPITGPAFEGRDLDRVKRYQVEMFGVIMGGGLLYTGRGMSTTHKGLRIQKQQFDVFCRYLLETLEELNLDQESKDIIMRFVTEMEGKIVNR
ncbi:unnamed protein product [Blepharisma stoltei]|uniref:Group 1 truncated hemoglobin n=1 Tax=Blepharisma stoltei TaxID=1481888 RepID=A0AAU9KDY8_9CILI|nr:unnamed protein product [Blepharisma stoltei]